MPSIATGVVQDNARSLRCQGIRSRFDAIHVQTSGISLPSIEPLTTSLVAQFRVWPRSWEGAQSLHIDFFDEAFSAPTEEAALVSLRVQQLIQMETNIVNTADPLAGSYLIEYLTNELEQRISGCVASIERMGGLVAAVERGWLHREIAKTAYRQQKAIEDGQMKIVGVNFQRSEGVEGRPIDVFSYPADTERRQKAKLQRLRQIRDARRVQSTLDEIGRCCENEENVMPAVLEAVKARATLGEIQQVYRKAFGQWALPCFSSAEESPLS